MNEAQQNVWNMTCQFIQEIHERTHFEELAEAAEEVLEKIKDSPNKVKIVKDFLNSIINRVYFKWNYEEVTAASICLRDLEKVNL